jgi:hypothetical protein
MSPWSAAMRRAAISTALTLASSSPMKVRDEPVTLWTMAMLPATRLGSWARKRVGRRSFESRSLMNSCAAGALPTPSRMVWSTIRSRSPPAAATTMLVLARMSRLPVMPASSSASPAV